MDEDRPFVFIGSSAEGLDAAKAIQANLDRCCEPAIWSQGVFGLSEGSLEALVKRVDDFDFAILVLTPDDLVASRGEMRPSPRDNVLLELGLFIGALGRERTFMVYRRDAKLKLPSDLAGITPATYQQPDSGTLQSALGSACTTIEEVIKGIGRRRAGVWISGGTYHGIGGIEGITITVENKGQTPVLPYQVCIAHPRHGRCFSFPSTHSGELLPSQRREHLCRLLRNGTLTQQTCWHWLKDEDCESETVFRLELEHSDRVLYENTGIGRAIITILRKVMREKTTKQLSYEELTNLHSESWRWKS